jgi:hypothetical protein
LTESSRKKGIWLIWNFGKTASTVRKIPQNFSKSPYKMPSVLQTKKYCFAKIPAITAMIKWTVALIKALISSSNAICAKKTLKPGSNWPKKSGHQFHAVSANKFGVVKHGKSER